MTAIVLMDTGVLVAYLKKEDNFHQWPKQELGKLQPPLLSCEAVITESCFLLRQTYQGYDKILGLLQTGQIQLPMRLDQECEAIRKMMNKYQSVPMSLADACLVRMAELYENSKILTLDSDFFIYRKSNNKIIPLIIPQPC